MGRTIREDMRNGEGDDDGGGGDGGDGERSRTCGADEKRRHE